MNNSWINGLKPIRRLRLLLVPLLLLGLILLSCDQDSIFFDISNEPEPKDPRIPGSPTSIVLARNRLYVGSRMGNRIYCYYNSIGGTEWTSFQLPQGSLGELATDGNDLYALVYPTGEPLNSSAVRRYNLSTNSWDMSYTVSGYSIQTLFGANGKIFAGGQHYSNYQNFAIFYLDPHYNSLTAIKYETSLLKGAVQGIRGIYLATAGNGILMFNEGSMDAYPASNTEEANFAGIISVEGTIVAVTGEGAVYIDSGGGFSYVSTGANYTGGMCVWSNRRNQWKPSLLLMGTRGKGTSLTHGYREMLLDNNGRPTFNIRTPGDESPTSVVNKAKYQASIGTHPVMSIMQIPDFIYGGPLQYSYFTGNPDWEPPIFASTAKNGLWSYRNGEWNAEE